MMTMRPASYAMNPATGRVAFGNTPGATPPSETPAPSPVASIKTPAAKGKNGKFIKGTLLALAMLGVGGWIIQRANNRPAPQTHTAVLPEASSQPTENIVPAPEPAPQAPQAAPEIAIAWHTFEDSLEGQKLLDAQKGKPIALKRMTFHYSNMPSKELQSIFPEDYDNDYVPFKALFPDDYKGRLYIGQTWDASHDGKLGLVKFIPVGKDKQATAELHKGIEDMMSRDNGSLHNMPTYHLKGVLSAEAPPAQVVRTRSDKDTYPTYLVQVPSLKDITFDSMLHGENK